MQPEFGDEHTKHPVFHKKNYSEALTVYCCGRMLIIKHGGFDPSVKPLRRLLITTVNPSEEEVYWREKFMGVLVAKMEADTPKTNTVACSPAAPSFGMRAHEMENKDGTVTLGLLYTEFPRKEFVPPKIIRIE